MLHSLQMSAPTCAASSAQPLRLPAAPATAAPVPPSPADKDNTCAWVERNCSRCWNCAITDVLRLMGKLARQIAAWGHPSARSHPPDTLFASRTIAPRPLPAPKHTRPARLLKVGRHAHQPLLQRGDLGARAADLLCLHMASPHQAKAEMVVCAATGKLGAAGDAALLRHPQLAAPLPRVAWCRSGPHTMRKPPHSHSRY